MLLKNGHLRINTVQSPDLHAVTELTGNALNIFFLLLFPFGNNRKHLMKYAMAFKCNMSDYFGGADCDTDHFMWFLHMDAVKVFSEGG
jgi:hypothetical protein